MSLFKAPAQIVNSATSVITTTCVVVEESMIEFGAAVISAGRITNKSLLILEKELDKQLAEESTDSDESADSAKSTDSKSVRQRIVRES